MIKKDDDKEDITDLICRGDIDEVIKSKTLGIDKPKMEFDHAISALRYSIFSRFGLNISPESRMTVSRMDRLRFEAEREGY
jgi:hypothetical protein